MPKKKSGKKISVKPVFHIFCEGEKTEPYYIKGFINEFFSEKRNVLIVEKSKKNTPRELVEEAISEQPNYGKNDEVWVVYDRESISKYPHSLHKEALDKARKYNISVAFSSVCFEIWILMHFTSSARVYSCYDDLRNNSQLRMELQKLGVNDYDKALPFLFQVVKNNFSKAVKNSKIVNKASTSCAVRGQSEIYHLNPYTNVYELFEEMEKFCQKY